VEDARSALLESVRTAAAEDARVTLLTRALALMQGKSPTLKCRCGQIQDSALPVPRDLRDLHLRFVNGELDVVDEALDRRAPFIERLGGSLQGG